MWGRLGFFFSSLFSVWRVLLPFIFPVKCRRQTSRHGGEEPVLPPLCMPPPHPVGGPGRSPDPQALPCFGCLPARSLSPDRVTVPITPLAWMVSEGYFCPQLLPKDEQRPRAQD